MLICSAAYGCVLPLCFELGVDLETHEVDISSIMGSNLGVVIRVMRVDLRCSRPQQRRKRQSAADLQNKGVEATDSRNGNSNEEESGEQPLQHAYIGVCVEGNEPMAVVQCISRCDSSLYTIEVSS